MKKLIQQIRKKHLEIFERKQNLSFILIIAALFTITSCDDYYDGRPGRAYLSLTWYDAEPTFIDVGTHEIPETFYWDDYYRIDPGIYLLYYEGEIKIGPNWAYYSWEIEYEIWVNRGEDGIPGEYFGMDGEDTYFTVECSPYGPYIVTEEGYYKSSRTKQLPENFELISKTDNEIIIQQTAKTHSIKATYRKVERRK